MSSFLHNVVSLAILCGIVFGLTFVPKEFWLAICSAVLLAISFGVYHLGAFIIGVLHSFLFPLLLVFSIVASEPAYWAPVADWAWSYQAGYVSGCVLVMLLVLALVFAAYKELRERRKLHVQYMNASPEERAQIVKRRDEEEQRRLKEESRSRDPEEDQRNDRWQQRGMF